MKVQYYIDEIKKQAGLTAEEIEKMKKAKIEEMRGLLSPEGALFIIAKDLGVEIKNISNVTKNITIDIADITSLMKMITINGRVANIRPIHEFQREGKTGKVINFTLFDKTASIKAVAWNEKADFINSEVNEGDIIRIMGAYGKEGISGNTELHIGGKNRIVINPSDVDGDQCPETVSIIHKLSDIESIDVGNLVSVNGTISEDPEFKTVTSKKSGEELSLLSVTISDDSGSVRVVMWRDIADTYRDLLSKGMKVSLTNLSVNYNSFNKAKEVVFTSISSGKITQ